MLNILVIIPAYNEAANIVPVVRRLQSTCPGYDFVVVNDGSHDETARLCRENGFPLLDLPVNLGLSGAVGTGMKYAFEHGYDAAIQFDADGQHRPEYLPQLADKLREGYDIVGGSRYLEKPKPITPRMLGSRLITLAILLTTGQKLTDPTSGQRIYSRRIIHEFATQINHPPEPDTVSYLIRKGAKAAEIQVDMNERTAGTSYLNSFNSIGYMLRMGFSIMVVQRFRGGSLPPVQPHAQHTDDKEQTS
ncbi:glycosyltransferase family 2 protein [Ruminococcaceae bacterium OttesenSCG-928-I18]|nr:glycosyltransferase family 2 protein [Ruminococcaceae bacterium OttesenSCG-928-I18]